MPLMMTLSKWSLRVSYHFSQGHPIYSNLATVATVILWSWAETVTLCSPSTVWDDNSSTMVKQANFVNKLSSNYFHSITRWRATVTLRSLSRLSLRRSVRCGTGDSTSRPPTAGRPQLKRSFYEVVKLTSLSRKTAQKSKKKLNTLEYADFVML